MNAVKVKKVLYAFVHLVGPLSYLTISIIWGAFSLLNPHSKIYLIILA